MSKNYYIKKVSKILSLAVIAGSLGITVTNSRTFAVLGKGNFNEMNQGNTKTNSPVRTVLPSISTFNPPTNFMFVEDNLETLNQSKERMKYGEGEEAQKIGGLIGNFDVASSKAKALLDRLYGKSLRVCELMGIINSLRDYFQLKGIKCPPPLTRNEKRSFVLLVKYVEDNYELLAPHLGYVKLCDSSGRPLNLDE